MSERTLGAGHLAIDPTSDSVHSAQPGM